MPARPQGERVALGSVRARRPVGMGAESSAELDPFGSLGAGATTSADGYQTARFAARTDGARS
eukprot:2810242-Pyramimonas_sp.AAC.1